MAWHIVRLGQIDPCHLPDLHEMTGEASPEPVEQDPEDMARNVRLWRAVLRLNPETRLPEEREA